MAAGVRGDGPLLCGVDAGTSRIRAIVFEPDGRVIAEGASPTPTARPGPGLGEHDAGELWRAAAAALRAAVGGVDRPGRIASVAVGSMGEAGVLLDRAGRPVGPLLAWYDTRTADALAAFERRVVGRDALHRTTGLCPDPTFTLPKLLWERAHRPEALAAATAWLGVSGWLAWNLCGERATDLSLASRTMLLDLAAGTWSAGLLDAAGLPPGLTGGLAPAGARLGTVTPAAAAETGLPAGCVVGVGAHDHVCGLLAAGADRPGVMLDSLGTAEALMLATAAPSRDPRLLAAGINQGRIEAGGRATFYLFSGLPTCQAAVEWFRALWPGEGGAGGADHALLLAEAEAVPRGAHEAMFLPQLRLGSPPFPDPVGRGAYLGLSDGTTRGALYRALLEGLALDAANQLRVMREATGVPAPTRVVATGGGARNPLLMRLKASLYGRAIEVASMPEMSALGAALLGGLAAGLFPDLAAARAGLAMRHDPAIPDPDWTGAARGRRLAAYATAYARLREIHALLLPGNPAGTALEPAGAGDGSFV